MAVPVRGHPPETEVVKFRGCLGHSPQQPVARLAEGTVGEQDRHGAAAAMFTQLSGTTESEPVRMAALRGTVRANPESGIRAVCAEVLAEAPEQVKNYQGGKVGLMGWFVGQVMKKMRGNADPQVAKSILEELLAK